MRALTRGIVLLVPAVLLLPGIASRGDDAAISRVRELGKALGDSRLGKPRTLNDAYHPWAPPSNREEWEKVREQIRERILVSNGLWPLPKKTPLEPVVTGTIDRDDYTIEKVYFASLPGHYVTGNLYRPKKIEGKAPGVLCPHGHWPNGRFHDAGEAAVQQQIGQGAEKFEAGARYPLQARMAQLALLGCIVFHYDMVGYADSQQIGHTAGFTDVEVGLRLQNFMGLQTWNSIRALDFILSLEDVDPERIGVTGASGGGTQTFMLCAIDDRPAAAFPAVMVSTAMQGGCICENADYLRIGINNIALAACFAPKPQAMSGANDWTIDIETKGLPELKQVYSLYDKADLVHAKCYPQFGHNYNQVSRELMYAWFNEHLRLGHAGPIAERDFVPVPPAELAVFDDAHPRPRDAASVEQTREYLARMADEEYAERLPSSSDDVAEYRRIVGTAARVMLDELPAVDEVEVHPSEAQSVDGGTLEKGFVGRRDAGEQIPFVRLTPERQNKAAVLWIDGKGKAALFEKSQPAPAVRKLLDAGYTVVSADVFQTGEFLEDGAPAAPQVDQRYHGYTFGYNRPLVSNRVRDILTVLAFVSGHADIETVHLVGTGEAGPWMLLAAGLAGDHPERIARTVVADLNRFRFDALEATSDPMFLPGALKYGGMAGLAALAEPSRLLIFNAEGTPLDALKKVYSASGEELKLSDGDLKPADLASLLPAKQASR